MSGLNSLNLDFLPVQNIEDLDVIGVGAVPIGRYSSECTLMLDSWLLTSCLYVFLSRGEGQ